MLVKPRREYHNLNEGFFKFIESTGTGCHIQVELTEEWDVEASVIMTFDNGLSSDNNEETESSLIAPANNRLSLELPRKYIMVYRHFEQLGKTMENLIQLTAAAKHWGRDVVKPNVQSSRLSSETGRGVYPLETYFNVSKMNEQLYENGYSKLVRSASFLRDCNYIGSGVKTTVVHFIYNDYHKGNTKQWFHLKTSEFEDLLKRTVPTGWTECPFINKHLDLAKSLRGVVIGRQVCVNSEVIVSESVFQEEILGDDKCVIIVEWRGFGKNRTHFSFRPFLSPRKLIHNISASDLIMREVRDFVNSKLPATYVAVHLRTERLLGSFKKLRLCIDHVVYLVGILRQLRGASRVFLATDMTRFGSDAFVRRKFYTSNATGRYLVRREDLTRIHDDAVRRLNAVTYEPSNRPFSLDKGMFSLVEMNIMRGGLDLVTIGSGSFHAWLVSLFKQHNRFRRRGYTISEICNDGNK